MSESYFEFNGLRSTDFGITLKYGGPINSPSRDVEFVAIPGRDGDLILDNQRYANYEDAIDCFINPVEGKTLFEQARAIKRWLQSDFSYGRLVDSWDLDYYRKAVCVNTLDIEQVVHEFGRLRVVFNCKPLRYSVVGEQSIIRTGPFSLFNSEMLASLPYIKITGSGDITLFINNQSVVLKGVNAYIEIDSEMKNAFKGTEVQNNKMYSPFPTLEPGENNISFSGNVQSIETAPRWVTLA